MESSPSPNYAYILEGTLVIPTAQNMQHGNWQFYSKETKMRNLRSSCSHNLLLASCDLNRTNRDAFAVPATIPKFYLSLTHNSQVLVL